MRKMNLPNKMDKKVLRLEEKTTEQTATVCCVSKYYSSGSLKGGREGGKERDREREMSRASLG